MSELELYSSDEQEDEVVAELSAGYDIMLDKLREKVEESDDFSNSLEHIICRNVEGTIHQAIQQQQQDDESAELHPAYVDLIKNLEETGEVDVDGLVENIVHTMSQQLD